MSKMTAVFRDGPKPLNANLFYFPVCPPNANQYDAMNDLPVAEFNVNADLQPHAKSEYRCGRHVG